MDDVIRQRLQETGFDCRFSDRSPLNWKDPLDVHNAKSEESSIRSSEEDEQRREMG